MDPMAYPQSTHPWKFEALFPDPSYLRLLDSPWEFYVLVLSLSKGMGIAVGFREVAGFELVKLTIISPTDSLVPTFDK